MQKMKRNYVNLGD